MTSPADNSLDSSVPAVALRGVVKARITNALSRWLGHRLTVELIDVVWDDAAATLEVTVQYRPAGSADSRVVKFQRHSR